jgi:DUF1365 family protein
LGAAVKTHYIARGTVYHKRYEPIQHEFTYPYFALGIFQEQPFPNIPLLLGQKTFSLCQIHDRDYLTSGPETIRDKVRMIARQHGVDDDFSLVLLSPPKVLGYAFNPANFYMLMKDGHVTHLLAEVNNTYGDRHYYFMPDQANVPNSFECTVDKEFFVSPFNNLKGEYRYRVLLRDARVYIEMLYRREGKDLLTAYFQARLIPLTVRNLLATLLATRVAPIWSMRRIIHQALILRFNHGLKALIRPKPDHPHSIKIGKISWLGKFFRF